MNIPIKGEPKQRPRATHRGKHIILYTPKKTKDFETSIGQYYKVLGGEFFKDGLLCANIVFYFKPAKSLSEKKKLDLYGKPFAGSKGDIDNLLKSLFDGLNGVAYSDDIQICEVHARRVYSREDRIKLELVRL